MFIFIKNFENKTLTVPIEKTQKISIIFDKLNEVGYDVSELKKHRLMFSGKDLDLDKTFDQYNITDLATLYWYIRKPPGNCDMCGNH